MTIDDNSLRLTLDGQDKGINADAFFHVYMNTLAALKSIDKGLSTHGAETVDWQIVGAGKSSPIFAELRGASLIKSEKSFGNEVIRCFIAGVEQLNAGNACPAHFSKDTLRHIHKLVAVAARRGLKPVLSTSTKTIAIERTAAQNADWAAKTLAMRQPCYTEYGSLEGILVQLSASSKRDRIKMVVVDRLTADKTPCYPSRRKSQELDAKFRDAWNKRVSVTGKIRVDRSTRKPVKILVEDIRIFRDRANLPQIEDLRGIDITGGMNSAEYIRGIRDAE